MVTRLVADLLGELKLNVREIHSRKPQSYRTRVSDEFRKSKGLILVTSDVSARGVDYPDVTLVIQVNRTKSRSIFSINFLNENFLRKGYKFYAFNTFFDVQTLRMSIQSITNFLSAIVDNIFTI